MLSINKLAQELVEELLAKPEYYRVGVEKLPSGATVIDTGLKAHGGYEAGLMTTRIAMGGAGTAPPTIPLWPSSGLNLRVGQ